MEIKKYKLGVYAKIKEMGNLPFCTENSWQVRKQKDELIKKYLFLTKIEKALK